MNSRITRAVMIVLLATSISALAASGKAKAAKNPSGDSTNSAAATTPCPADPQKTQDKDQSGTSNDETQRKQLIEQQEKEWLRNVQYAN